MEVELSGIVVDCIQGNIADQVGIDAIVNAANAMLRMGGGVAGAIHRAAGPGLEKECAPLAPIEPGEAVITSGHNLPNPHVIHCLGPIYGRDKPEGELLADCYRNALRLADSNGLSSIAFPSISTGAFGYPKEEATQVAFSTIQAAIPELQSVKLIRFVLYSEGDLAVHKRVMETVFG